MRELRVAMLLVACIACLFSICQTTWYFYGGDLCVFVDNVVSRLSNFWS